MNRYFLLVLVGLALVPPVAAQHQRVEHESLAQVEIFGGYSYLRASGANFNGWNASSVVNVNRWLGLAADFSGHYHRESTPAGNVEESIHSWTFGPHFALRKHPRFTPFAFTLIGVSRESASTPGGRHVEVGFDSDLGGGLDWHASEKIGVRLFQANAAIAHLGGETKTDFRLSFGVVFHVGKK